MTILICALVILLSIVAINLLARTGNKETPTKDEEWQDRQW